MAAGSRGAGSAATARRARILVVEDEALIALTLVQMLEGFGLEAVGPAASVDEALALVAGEPVDAGVLDLRLDEARHGLEVAAALERHGIPFIVVSGFSHAYVQRLLPGCPTLTKPFDEAALRRALGALLGPAWE